LLNHVHFSDLRLCFEFWRSESARAKGHTRCFNRPDWRLQRSRRRRRTISVAWYLGIFIVFLAAFDMMASYR
jgi:hypothetical protein